MFTGLIQETGRVVSFAPQGEMWRLVVSARLVCEALALGDSIAVNGCCLTAVACEQGQLHFDLLAETRRVTSFASLAPGALVNLERALRFGGKMGGHFVSGHIDGTGVVELSEPRGSDHYVRVRAPAGTGRYLIPRGSIAMDGVSLTVAELDGDCFSVWLIPHTLTHTNLLTHRAGDHVNLEFDLLGKYVEKLLGSRAGEAVAAVS